jgi:peptide-methionine (S)-S-oxide reductase
VRKDTLISSPDLFGSKTKFIALQKAPDGLEEGMMVQLGNGMPAKVVGVTSTEVEIDANHQLAGKALNFEVELLDLTKA